MLNVIVVTAIMVVIAKLSKRVEYISVGFLKGQKC
jgi:hypothetical protein